ncbi:START domain-containing protein, partial [Pseudomonas aeruginosa]|uniref:START domain-containing protein n=1 Tax=Pseudomonas aeruginosa TaxID=287 RepID=UPI0039692886
SIQGRRSSSCTQQSRGWQPEEKGQIRVPKLVGEWKLQPKGQGVTEVTYQVETEPGGSIPSWLANSFE